MRCHVHIMKKTPCYSKHVRYSKDDPVLVLTEFFADVPPTVPTRCRYCKKEPRVWYNRKHLFIF